MDTIFLESCCDHRLYRLRNRDWKCPFSQWGTLHVALIASLAFGHAIGYIFTVTVLSNRELLEVSEVCYF